MNQIDKPESNSSSLQLRSLVKPTLSLLGSNKPSLFMFFSLNFLTLLSIHIAPLEITLIIMVLFLIIFPWAIAALVRYLHFSYFGHPISFKESFADSWKQIPLFIYYLILVRLIEFVSMFFFLLPTFYLSARFWFVIPFIAIDREEMKKVEPLKISSQLGRGILKKLFIIEIFYFLSISFATVVYYTNFFGLNEVEWLASAVYFCISTIVCIFWFAFKTVVYCEMKKSITREAISQKCLNKSGIRFSAFKMLGLMILSIVLWVFVSVVSVPFMTTDMGRSFLKMFTQISSSMNTQSTMIKTVDSKKIPLPPGWSINKDSHIEMDKFHVQSVTLMKWFDKSPRVIELQIYSIGRSAKEKGFEKFGLRIHQLFSATQNKVRENEIGGSILSDDFISKSLKARTEWLNGFKEVDRKSIKLAGASWKKVHFRNKKADYFYFYRPKKRKYYVFLVHEVTKDKGKFLQEVEDDLISKIKLK